MVELQWVHQIERMVNLLESYQTAVKLIVSTLRDFGRSDAVVRWYQAFFSAFEDFVSNHDSKTLDLAYAAWKQETFPNLSEHRRKIADSASKALICTVKNGHVPYDFFKTLPSKDRLVSEYYMILRDYANYARPLYSLRHLSTIESRCSVFLFWAQVNGIRQISDLNYEFLQLFYEEHNYSLGISKGMVLSTVESFLLYLADKALIPHAYALFMNTNRHAYLPDASAMNSEDKAKLKEVRALSQHEFPAEEFYASSLDFFNVLRDHQYEDTVRGIWKITSESLYLFLHRNHLGYRPEIVNIWYSYFVQNVSHSTAIMSRRLLKQYDQFTNNGNIDPLTIFSYTPSSVECLAPWCRPTVEAFLSRKKKEQLASSTVAMYRSSILRFCNWLSQNGVDNYSKITYEHIKRFDIEDPHSTIEGKVAYNSRIRRFLMYLEEKGFVTNHIFESIPATCANRERLVTVLTREEITAIDAYIAAAETELELRDAAMLQLGLRMGLRAVDVCNLKLDEIDWKNKSIRFIQQKTKVEAQLPMPICVGNAIYKYLHKRSKAHLSSFVFVPYAKRGYSLHPAACRTALHRAIPNFHSGFHSLRKTFSTGLLNRGVKPTVIDDALGHTSNSEQDRYLALDDERMMMCPLRLSDEGIFSPGRLLQ